MIYLIGASGHAKVVIDILEQNSVEIGGLVDKNPQITKLLEYDVNAIMPDSFDPLTDLIMITIGNNRIRKKLATENREVYYSAIHRSANISPRSVIGNGTVIMAGAIVNSSVFIGDHVILNTSSSIDHDCIIESFVHVSPNASLAGGVLVGEGAHIGIGACIIQGIKIGKWATIGAGAVIIKDVPDNAIVVGNPGKIKRYNSNE